MDIHSLNLSSSRPCPRPSSSSSVLYPKLMTVGWQRQIGTDALAEMREEGRKELDGAFRGGLHPGRWLAFRSRAKFVKSSFRITCADAAGALQSAIEANEYDQRRVASLTAFCSVGSSLAVWSSNHSERWIRASRKNCSAEIRSRPSERSRWTLFREFVYGTRSAAESTPARESTGKTPKIFSSFREQLRHGAAMLRRAGDKTAPRSGLRRMDSQGEGGRKVR